VSIHCEFARDGEATANATSITGRLLRSCFFATPLAKDDAHLRQKSLIHSNVVNMEECAANGARYVRVILRQLRQH
jgi:hypothetical protein